MSTPEFYTMALSLGVSTHTKIIAAAHDGAAAMI
jgi:hypothetical protein